MYIKMILALSEINDTLCDMKEYHEFDSRDDGNASATSTTQTKEAPIDDLKQKLNTPLEI